MWHDYPFSQRNKTKKEQAVEIEAWGGEGGGGEGGQGFGGKNLKIEKIHSESQDSKIGCILVRN